MTIEAGLTQLQVDVAELADESQSLAKSVTSSLAEIDAVKGDIQNTHNFVDSNYQAMNDWQTKHGTVTFKNLQGQSKQVNTLSKLILDSEKINPNPHVMSKAQFDALRELRKQQYAGSGFVEWGKHWAGSGADGTVNEGLWPYFKEMRWGRRNNVSDAGSSHAGFPIAVIDGVSHHIKGTALNATEAENNIQIQFPPAPDGTKTYDSATGVVTEHASAAKAFEGVVTNGDFRNGSTGWTLSTGWSVADGRATRSGTNTNTQIRQTFNVVAGVTYEVSYFREHTSGNLQTNVYSNLRTGAGIITLARSDSATPITVKDTFTPTSSGAAELAIFAIGDFEGSISNITLRPVTESVITSRKDLVFLETWHEKIADKDVVYPLGNVQYGGTTFDGMTMDLSPSGIAQGYSAFGEWDTTTNGRGHRWTTLIDSEKKKFIDNPENNIYYDSEADELIQVRYRIRVVEGSGADWDGYRAADNTGTMRYSANRHIKPWGFNADGHTRGDYLSGDYFFFVNKEHWESFDGSQSGSFGVRQQEAPYYSERGCNAIPIALVQRMNQGAYHPTYNPMGCVLVDNIADDNHGFWYESTVNPLYSTSDAFTKKSKVARSGAITGVSGRQDQYEFYDAIYAGQVEDLRLNANKLDVNQLREESMRKAVAGEMRGKGKVPFTFVMPLKQSTTGLVNQGWVCFIGPDSPINFYTHPVTKSIPRTAGVPNTSGLSIVGSFKVGGTVYTFDEVRLHTTGHQYIYFKLTAGTLVSTSKKTKVIFSLQDSYKSTSEFESLPWVDIIGDPERIAATFPDGVVGQWVPQVPVDSVSQQFPLNRKNMQGDYTRTYTFDDGASWTSNTHTIQETINRTDATFPDSRYVSLLHYESPSNFTEPSNNSVVVGGVGDVWAGNDARVEFGNRLQGSVSDEMGTTVAYTSNRYAPVDGHTVWSNGSVLMPDEYPSHTCLPSLGGVDGNMGVKALSTVTEKDGLLYLQLHGAELKHQPLGAMHTINAGVAFNHTKEELAILQGFDNASFNVPVIFLNDKAMTLSKTYFNRATIKSDGTIVWQSGLVDTNLRVVTSSTAWGDDQVIPIVNGEDVKTDLNGNTVKVFCHHTQIPLGIASN